MCITPVPLELCQVIAFSGLHVSTRAHLTKREGLKLLEQHENIISKTDEMCNNAQVKKIGQSSSKEQN